MGAFATSVLGGLIGGIISPFVLSWLRHHWIWKAEKNWELKQQAFDGILAAFAAFSSDALDLELQKVKPSIDGVTPHTNFRPETRERIEQAQARAQAFFSQNAAEQVRRVFSADMGLDKIPHIAFQESRTEAIKTLASEVTGKKRD